VNSPFTMPDVIDSVSGLPAAGSSFRSVLAGVALVSFTSVVAGLDVIRHPAGTTRPADRIDHPLAGDDPVRRDRCQDATDRSRDQSVAPSSCHGLVNGVGPTSLAPGGGSADRTDNAPGHGFGGVEPCQGRNPADPAVAELVSPRI
jgi:hypothetical protein